MAAMTPGSIYQPCGPGHRVTGLQGLYAPPLSREAALFPFCGPPRTFHRAGSLFRRDPPKPHHAPHLPVNAVRCLTPHPQTPNSAAAGQFDPENTFDNRAATLYNTLTGAHQSTEARDRWQRHQLGSA